jgi:hypothetical protein
VNEGHLNAGFSFEFRVWSLKENRKEPFYEEFLFIYWSATSSTINTSAAWDVFFGDGVVSTGVGKGLSRLVWCVRGGQGVDAQ